MAFTIPNTILATNVDSVEEFIGFKLPITFETNNQSITTLESTKANLTSLLFTTKGERVFQPDLGVNLRTHLFNPISTETTLQIEEDIIEQISIWLPFLEVKNAQFFDVYQVVPMEVIPRNKILCYAFFRCVHLRRRGLDLLVLHRLRRRQRLRQLLPSSSQKNEARLDGNNLWN